jgi:hypothetical protein
MVDSGVPSRLARLGLSPGELPPRRADAGPEGVGRAVKPGNGSHSSNCFSALVMAARAALGPAAAAVAALLSGPASGEGFGGCRRGRGGSWSTMPAPAATR